MMVWPHARHFTDVLLAPSCTILTSGLTNGLLLHVVEPAARTASLGFVSTLDSLPAPDASPGFNLPPGPPGLSGESILLAGFHGPGG